MEELEDRSYAIPEPLQDEKDYDIVADMVATAQEPRTEISNVEFSKFQSSSDNAFSNLLGTNEPKKKGFQNEGFALGDAYDRLSDGTLSGKYENFLQGSDNEERLAKEQSSGEQWRNGIAKFWGKTITAVGGGTAGTLYGIGDALMKGDFTSIYDNDFYDVMDDLNKRMDNGLSNYYTKEQKEMGFLESVGTVNFWANDFLGGLSFTAGAIASEAIWAAATGGTSLVAAAGRYGLKASKALSGIKKAKSLTNAFTGYMSKANALRSATKYGRYASLANASRIAYTSAGYEAGVESRMFKQEQEEAFDNYFKGLGREATTQEIASFNDELSGKTNAVFATNMALVGSSNLITFGKIFNVGNPLKSTSSSVKKALFGEGVELVEGVMKPVKRNIAQRIAGVSYHALKNPVVEGVFEEGGQSVTTKTAGSMIESMYNVDKDVLSFTEAFHEGMVETYGTKEGRKEVFLGMLIGAVGGGGSSLMAKQNPFAEIKDAAGKVSKKDIERIEQYEKGVNTKEAVGLLTGAYGNEVSQKVVAEIARANGLSASTKQMDEAVKNGDLNGYEQGRLSGILANVIYAENTGLSDLVEEQIATEIENTTEADYENSKADGFDLKEAKEKAKRDYKKIKDDFSRAKEASSYLIGSLSKKEEKLLGKNTETLRTMLAYNSVMTERTLDYADELNTSLIEVVGEYAGQDFKGLGTASKIKVTLDKAKKEQSRLFYNTNRRLKTATKSYDRVTKEIESQAEQLTSTPESQKTKTEKLLKLQNKQKELLEQKEALRKERDLVLKTIRIQTNSNKNRQDTSVDLTISEDIDNIEERLNDINSIVEDIAKTDYEKYIRLKSTITAYQKAIKSAKQMSEIMEDLSNTETGLKGATRTFLNTAREYNEPTKRLIKNLEDIFEERKNEAEQRDNLRDVVEKINTQKISSFDPVATPDTTVKDIQSQIDEINEKYDKQIEEIENEPDVSTLSIKDIERQRKNRLENMNIGDTIESINQEFDTILKINGLYDKKNDIQKRRRQELNEVKKAIKERQKREINAKYDAELAELKAETTTTTSNQSTEVNIEKRRQEELNIPDLVVNSESKQALIDIINLTDSKDIADFVNKGTWNNEGDLGFDENGNVVLTRFADSKEGLTKSGNITSPSELKSLMNNYGGEQIPTSGVVGGIEAYASENGVIGTYRIPLSEFKELLKQGYIQFAGFGNKEFVLSPHIASKYLSEINGKLLTESKINTKYDAELAELKAEEQTKAETTTPTSNQSEIEAKKAETEQKIQNKSLFSDGGIFANELGGSGVNSVPTNHREISGIEFIEFSNPITGVVDVVMTGTSDVDYVGYYRLYENGKPTNKWSSKFENKSRNKDNFKTMISGVQEMLPQGHEYTEKTSISTDGLRVWNQQLSRGYELQYDSKGDLITNTVAINGDAIVNELGIDVNQGNFDNISVTNKEQFELVKKALLPYLQKFGLNEKNIYWTNGTVEVDIPVLKNNKSELKALEKLTTTTEDIKAKKAEIERRRQEEISSKSKTRKGNTISIFEVSKRQNDAVFNDKEWKKLNDYTTKLPKGVVMEGTPMYDELVALGVKPSSNGINGTDVVKKLEEIANKVKAKTKANIKSEGLKVITNDARALADKKFFDGINAKYDAELAELKAETKTTTPNQSEIENLEKQKQQELNDIKIDNSDEALKKINDIYEKELADTRSQKIDKNTQKERVNKKRRQELQEINSNKQQVSEAIDEIFSKYKGLVENVDNPEDSRPTEEDFSRYMELISKTKVNSDTLIGKNYQNASTRVIKKTGLTKSELLEFQKVSRKLADWQIISGMTNGDVSLKDLLDQKLSSQKEVVKTTTTSIDAKQEEEMIQGVINERVTSDTHVKNINTSDSVLVQKRKGEYNISHFKVEKYDENIEIIKSKKATSNKNGILTFKKGDQEFTVGTTLSGRYVIDNEEDFNKFLDLLDMKVMSFKGQKNTWSAIYSKEDNGQYGLQESHFEVNQIDSADINIIEPQKLYDMEPGEKLFFKVSLRDSYNTVLINDPKISRKKLVKNVNIYVVNEKGDVLGQIKSSNSNTTHTEKTKEIREQAANFVWEQINPDVAPVQVTGTENIAGFSVQKATATKMQEIVLPFYTEITRVYTNSPNVKLNSQGEVIQQDIPQGSIESYGVLKNGEIILNENSKAKVADISRTYLKTLDNTPIIIVKQGKKLIAYPARIKPKQINLGESLMEVLKDENNDSDKIIAISDFLANNGIDPKKYNLKHVSAENSSLYDGTVETIMDDIKGMASYITEEEYLSKTFTPSRLENEVTTSLNLKNKPFRNPKLEMESEKIEINEDISDKYYERHFNRNKNIPQSYLEQIAQKLDIDLKPLGKLTKFNKKILSLYTEDIKNMVKERFKMTPQNQATSKSNQQVKCKS